MCATRTWPLGKYGRWRATLGVIHNLVRNAIRPAEDAGSVDNVRRSRSVRHARRDLVRELGDRVHDPTPHGRPVVVAGGHEFVSSGGAFLERLVAIALEHQLRRPPNVDLRDHALKLHIYAQ